MTPEEWAALETGDYVWYGLGRKTLLRKILKASKKRHDPIRTSAIVLRILRPSWTGRDYTVYVQGDRYLFERAER